jgi:glycosyltransferase involved in cell wall biosynthesis
MRTLYVKLRKYSTSLRRALRTAELVLATNPETKALLYQAGAHGARLFLDCGLLQESANENPQHANDGERCTFLWAGRLESRKGLPLALDAMAKLRDLPVELLIAGQGPERAAYEDRVRQAGLSDKVRFLGPVPYADMPALFRRSDAFLFTSIRDSSGSVVLEAMSHALPILTLAHQGIGAFVPEEAGIKIPVKTPAQVIDELAQAMRKVAECADYRLQMGAAALARVRLEAWPKRVERLVDLYEEVISAHRRI